jgi:hypothetical protein
MKIKKPGVISSGLVFWLFLLPVTQVCVKSKTRPAARGILAAALPALVIVVCTDRAIIGLSTFLRKLN